MCINVGDEEFFSPEREEVQNVHTSSTAQHPQDDVPLRNAGRVGSDSDGGRKVESPSPVVPSAAFYDVL